MRFSRRSRSFSRARSRSLSGTTSVSRCAVTHLFSVERPTPKSDATCLRVSPLVSAIRTASARNSSVLFVPIVCLPCCSKCYQRGGIKPRQVQPFLGLGGDGALPRRDRGRASLFREFGKSLTYLVLLAMQPTVRISKNPISFVDFLFTSHAYNRTKEFSVCRCQRAKQATMESDFFPTLRLAINKAGVFVAGDEKRVTYRHRPINLT